MYKLDRTAFKIQTFEEASSYSKYWYKQTVTERLKAVFYLNSVAFNFDLNKPPEMERQLYSERKRS